MSSFGVQNHDTMLRQAFYTFCDSEDSSDMKFIGKDGSVNCHKIVILKVFPRLKTIFCKFCSESHENVVIIFPEVDKDVIKKARDDLYLFGDTSAIAKLFSKILGNDRQDNFVKVEELEEGHIFNEHDDLSDNESLALMEEVNDDVVSTNTLEKGEGNIVANEEDNKRTDIKSCMIQDNVAPMVYDCPHCSFKTFVGSYMKNHITKEHGNFNKDSSTDHSATEIVKMNPKEALKSKKTKATLSCKLCNAFFKTRNDLKFHKKEQHNPDNEIPCPSCDQLFLSKREVKKHIDEIHFPVYSCETCNAEFKVKKELRTHITEAHAMEEEYPCDVCSKQFKKKNLKQHIMSHQRGRELKYACDSCDFRSQTKIGLVVHTKKEHEQ